MPDLLELEDVHTDIGQHHILQGVSLRVRPDAVTVLLGRNGAGKTTTMRTIMGVLRPRRGTVRFDGRPIHALAPHAIARLGIGYVPEGQGIFATLTVDENLRVAMLAETAESRDRLRRGLLLEARDEVEAGIGDRCNEAKKITFSVGLKPRPPNSRGQSMPR